MIYVLTATIPERKEMLNRLKKCLQNQTFQDFKHIVFSDVGKKGNYYSYNQLLQTDGIKDNDYITFCDDDDILYSNHLQELWQNKDKADIVYNICDLEDPSKEKMIWYNDCFDYGKMLTYNFVPITAMVQKSKINNVLFSDSQDCDFKFWQTLILDKDFSVYQNFVKTWFYVFHGSNFSRLSLTK